MQSIKILLLSIFIFSFSFAKAISLKDAIAQKKVSVAFSKNENSENSYYGDCIKLKIKNNNNKKLEIEIQPGMFLMPEDSAEQRMMIAEEMMFALNSSSSKDIIINAFCTQMHHESPKESTIFKVGKMAKGYLLELSKLINKHRFFSSAAQDAVWCITDGHDIFSINSINDEETNILRNFVSKATGQKLREVHVKSTPVEESANRQSGRYQAKETIIKDSVSFSNREGGKYSLIMFTEDGDEMVVFFKDKYKKPTFRTTVRFSLTYTSFPAGTYFIRMYNDKGDIMYNKEVEIKEAD
jgi:predicted SnoaL-like aldol condensation-catalyzing enzyme